MTCAKDKMKDGDIGPKKGRLRRTELQGQMKKKFAELFSEKSLFINFSFADNSDVLKQRLEDNGGETCLQVVVPTKRNLEMLSRSFCWRQE